MNWWVIILLVMIISVSSSRNITLSKETLPAAMRAICGGYYQEIYNILFSNIAFMSNNRWNDWYQKNEINTPFDIYSMQFGSQGCTQKLGEPLLYIIPYQAHSTNTNISIQGGQFLLIFDLQNQYYQQITYDAILPIIAVGGCIIFVDDMVYVIGGYNFYPLNHTQRYDIIKNEWIIMNGQLNTGRWNHGCSAVHNNNNNIYAFGGGGGSAAPSNTIEKYNISHDKWVQLNVTLRIARSYLSCQYLFEFIFCFGGYGDLATYPSLIEVFNPFSDTIIDIINIDMNLGRTYFSIIKINDALIVMGGRHDDDLNSIEILNRSVINK